MCLPPMSTKKDSRGHLYGVKGGRFLFFFYIDTLNILLSSSCFSGRLGSLPIDVPTIMDRYY